VNGNQSNNSATEAGAAYVFVRNGTTWSQQAYLKASNTGASDSFGGSVAVSGDTVVVGAPGEGSSATGVNGNQADNSVTGAGAAYVFTGFDGGPVSPVITHHPLSQTNAIGTTASFTVAAVGEGPLCYQWRKFGTNLLNDARISGVATTNLVIADVQPGDAGDYSVVVTNAYGSTTSSVAQLTVVVPPNPGRFTSLVNSPTMGFSFIFRDATIGLPVRIQRSSSLAEGSWSNWQSFTYTEPVMFTDLGATDQERRFYRAVSP
jgi:hypothetical protein